MTDGRRSGVILILTDSLKNKNKKNGGGGGKEKNKKIKEKMKIHGTRFKILDKHKWSSSVGKIAKDIKFELLEVDQNWKTRGKESKVRRKGRFS